MNQIPERASPATEPAPRAQEDLPPAPPAQEELPPAPPGQEDLLGRRSGAALIDVALLTGVLVIFSLTVGEIRTESGTEWGFYADLSPAWWLVYLAVVLGYYFVFEVVVGQSVGKRLLGLRVTRADGSRPSMAAIAVRTLLRLVDWLPFLYLVGFLAMLATGERRMRLGDLAARTTVARALPVGHRGLALVPVALVAVLLALSAYYASVTGSAAWTIDSARVEDALGRDMKESNPGLRVGGVACPEGIRTVEGATFQCTAEVEGEQAPFRVTVTEVDASTGEVKTTWKPTKAILVIDKLVKHLKSSVQDQTPNATVDCGTAPVRVVEVGGAIECIISEGSNRLVVRGVVQDAEGSVRFEQQD
jgi:uncharacterized RDD family membrane protein YckC